jgi:hypothetical protein
MGKKKTKPRQVRIVEIREVDVEAIVGDQLPVKRIDIDVDGKRKGIVFTVSRQSVNAARPGWLQDIGQILGNLVHPHPATLIVLPAGETLGAYEVTAS